MSNTLPRFVRTSEEEDLQEQIRQLQENLEVCLKFISEVPHLDGVLLENVEVNGATKVAHKLGRSLIGWMVVKNTTAGDLPYETDRDDQYLTLYTAGSQTLDLWVF